MIRSLVLLSLLISNFAWASGSSVRGSYVLEKLSCHKARQIVDEEGAVVFFYKNETRFDRVVKNSRYCMYAESLNRAAFDVKDFEDCDVGYTCSNNQANH